MKREIVNFNSVEDRIMEVRGEKVILDSDVAALYGVETRVVNQAVRNNPEKFPKGYIINIDKQEFTVLTSKFLISSENEHGGRRHMPKAFTEKGLYMLATILKSERATQATLLIVETFAKVRSLKQELVAMQTTLQNSDLAPQEQKTMVQRFGEALSDIVMPDLQPYEAAAEVEINFFIGKLKYTVKRRKDAGHTDTVE